ncbi:MAG: hypothetical protein KJO40_17770 [Deltaproteobacteria bacterium]|nr:hypothetical protein [Deltaproteobacteria bacterium]NND29892.1 hypothetical protein [Myxococcales bacterium]MBT8481662.1 hypothetical protein [Deltaproteobacteria bacterium]NNK08874.1 hypothetical protein [Myxococcales bacterium]NNK44041.1 hypothetical protein [Myxococcales bacterium]
MPKPASCLLFPALVSMLLLAACGSDSTLEDCNYASTYDAIQASIFEAKGCTASSCHGEAMLGGLDLRANASFDALVRQPSTIDPSIQRVFPGDHELSLLYLKLEAATEGTDLGSLGQPMPIEGEPLSADELDAMRLWMRAGAPADSIVGGTLELLGCAGTFEPDPNKINPLPAPAPDEGVQFYAGGWGLDGESEDEVCFASYYDFTDTVPPDFQVDCDEFGEGRKCFAFRRNELAQDGQSHHSIISVYTPESDPKGEDWGPWACLGGDRAGQTCDPTAADACGPRSQCTTPAVTSVACVGYRHAPQDFGLGGGLGGSSGDTVIQLGGAQESTSVDVPPPGVYSVLPLKGFVSWNSHGFNLTKKRSSIEQWVNLTFAPEAERVFIREQIFEADNIFAMSTVTPFEKREICMTWTLPRYAQLMSLSSHMHVRGELFRIWLPPNEPCVGTAGCVPPTTEADYVSRLYDDPLYTYYDPPNDYSSAADEDRTLKACAVYDNGADNPLEVKRESTKPNTPTCSFFLANCGCEARERVCLGGAQQGTSCNGDNSVCGDGGVCDACPLYGGVTTDDEMFIPLGSYFVAEPSP